MSYTPGPPFGGESQDNDMEMITSVRSSDCAVDTTAARLVTGTQCIKSNMAAVNKKCIRPAFGSVTTTISGKLLVMSGYIGIDANPASEFGVVSNSTQAGERYLRVDTSGKFRFYDSGGTQIGPTGTTSVSTTGMTQWTAVWDFSVSYTGSRQNGFIKLYVNKVEEMNFWFDLSGTSAMAATADIICFGEWLPAGSHHTVNVFTDDEYGEFSSTTSDAPYVTAYPVVHVVGGAARPPTSEGTTHAWTSTTASPNSWQDVDDYPYSGTFDNINTASTSTKHLFKSSAANPLTALTPTVRRTFIRCVANEAGGGKTGHDFLLRDASGNEATSSAAAYSTARVGVAPALNYLVKPGGDGTGTDFVYTDANNTAGVSDQQFGAISSSVATAGPTIQSLEGIEWVYYTETLPLGTGPFMPNLYNRYQKKAPGKGSVGQEQRMNPYAGFFATAVTPSGTRRRFAMVA